MTIQSSIPAVITQLVSTITTAVAGQVAPSGQPVYVFDGELGTNIPDAFVVLTGVTNGQQVWATIGKQRRSEQYDVVGMVRVYAGGDDQALVRNAAFAVYALVETALDTDPSLSGVVNIQATCEPRDLRMGVTDQGGRAAELDFAVLVSTQLIAT